jgi:hypothetical protein
VTGLFINCKRLVRSWPAGIDLPKARVVRKYAGRKLAVGRVSDDERHGQRPSRSFFFAPSPSPSPSPSRGGCWTRPQSITQRQRPTIIMAIRAAITVSATSILLGMSRLVCFGSTAPSCHSTTVNNRSALHPLDCRFAHSLEDARHRRPFVDCGSILPCAH